MNTRRAFLAGLAVTGTVLQVGLSAAQLPQSPQTSQDKNGQPPTMPDSPLAPSAEKHMLDENEKEIKKKVDRLYELATELKAEVDKTDSSKVLSLNMLKKTEEIEKLAKEIHGRAKG